MLDLGALPVAAHTWEVTSPDRGQTFAYGSERHRQWIAQGDRLGITMEFTNDPYVDTINSREYDDFCFRFSQIRLGPDGRTFFYFPAGQRPIAVAERSEGLLGEAHLLPSSRLVVAKRHGVLELTLLVSNEARGMAADEQ